MRQLIGTVSIQRRYASSSASGSAAGLGFLRFAIPESYTDESSNKEAF